MNGISGLNDFEEVRVPVPWGYITGKWWGPTHTQPIIAIHGWQDNCCTFDRLAPFLKDRGFSIYCIDLPGHGFSSHIPKGHQYTIHWDGLYYLRKIVTYFGWSNISIIGHSLGASIGFMYSAIYPNDVKKFVSIDTASPGVYNMAERFDSIGSKIDRFMTFEQKFSNEDLPMSKFEDILEVLIAGHKGSLTRESAEIMSKRGVRRHKTGGYVFTRDIRLIVAATGFLSIDQVMELASRIKCEVLNIRAEKSKNIPYSVELYEQTLDKIGKSAKKLERHVLVGTHHIHLNDSDTVAPIVYHFLTN